ncbi:hypothetical protein NOVOSPHI9U_210014 [Novosphingobium sp. 9U]|nr:hypothetical protein NOVOSPHI9U_210014 [Novosphingobium sp. 9U]
MIPSWSNVRLAGRCDCSTLRMILGFSDAEYLMRRRPHPRSCFFEQSVPKRQIGVPFLQGTGLAAQILNLFSRGGAGGVTGQATFAGFHELLRRYVMQALRDAFLATQLGHAVLAAQV